MMLLPLYTYAARYVIVATCFYAFAMLLIAAIAVD